MSATERSNASDASAWGRKRTRAKSSLLAAGEPMVWLTGGTLVVCTVMVFGLLALVLRQGMGTFWPAPVERVETEDGRVFMGEVTRREQYLPEPTTLSVLPDVIQAKARTAMAEGDGTTRRQLVRTGNFRLTQNHFAWVSDYEVRERDRPEWAMVLERLEWGRFYGMPESFARIDFANGSGKGPEALRRLLDGLSLAEGEQAMLVAEQYVDGREQILLLDPIEIDTADGLVGVAAVRAGSEATWDAFNTFHGEVRKRWRQRRSLEEHDTGKVNHEQEKARLAVRSAELVLARLEAKGDGASASALERARARVAEAEATYAEKTEWANEAFAEIRREIDDIDNENRRYQLVMRTAGEGNAAPKTTLVELGDVVRAYPANTLSAGDKVGIYFSRWREFLTDEPREANSEGGVFPAIFGTVAMTLIMSIAVVPFGVLAALYLREYAKAGALVSAVRIAVNNLAGVPSIVFGVFGLGFFCYVVGASLDQLLFAAHLPNPTYGKGGLLWASLTLALLTLPVIIVATEEAIAAVPSSMREGSYACGASKWQTIVRIVLPRAMPGIITGMVLAIARGAGEVAPLMLVGAVKLAPELPIDGLAPFVHPERSFMHLGFHIYDVGFQSQNSEAAKPMVFTTTLLLILIVAFLNLAAIWLRGRLRRKFAGSQF